LLQATMVWPQSGLLGIPGTKMISSRILEGPVSEDWPPGCSPQQDAVWQACRPARGWEDGDVFAWLDAHLCETRGRLEQLAERAGPVGGPEEVDVVTLVFAAASLALSRNGGTVIGKRAR